MPITIRAAPDHQFPRDGETSSDSSSALQVAGVSGQDSQAPQDLVGVEAPRPVLCPAEGTGNDQLLQHQDRHVESQLQACFYVVARFSYTVSRPRRYAWSTPPPIGSPPPKSASPRR